MKTTPNFVIHSIDKETNSIFAYTSYDLKEPEQWRWFGLNIAIAYEPYFKNFKLYLFTTKKQTEKFLNNILNKKEHLDDTKKAFKLFFESSPEQITVITNPLIENVEICFNKKDNQIEEENFYVRYNDFKSCEVFPNLSFVVDTFNIETAENQSMNDVYSTMLIGCEENLAEEEIFTITKLAVNLFSQYQIIKSLSSELALKNIEEKIVLLNKDKIEIYKKTLKNTEKGSIFEVDKKKELNINKDVIYSEFVFSSFYSEDVFEDYAFNMYNNKATKRDFSAIVLYPYSNIDEVVQYVPQMYYLPSDKEYFELKGYKENT